MPLPLRVDMAFCHAELDRDLAVGQAFGHQCVKSIAKRGKLARRDGEFDAAAFVHQRQRALEADRLGNRMLSVQLERNMQAGAAERGAELLGNAPAEKAAQRFERVEVYLPCPWGDY